MDGLFVATRSGRIAGNWRLSSYIGKKNINVIKTPCALNRLNNYLLFLTLFIQYSLQLQVNKYEGRKNGCETVSH
jgi:hypothetical protein